MLTRSGRDTDLLGKEYWSPREGILASSGRNADLFGAKIVTFPGRNSDPPGKLT
jgi:hypothetical protein